MIKRSLTIVSVLVAYGSCTVAQPVRLVGQSGTVVWIDSTLFTPTLGPTLIASIKQKKQFTVDVSDELLPFIKNLFLIAHADYSSKASQVQQRDSIFEYISQSGKQQPIERMLELLSFVQQYFDLPYNEGLAQAIGVLSKGREFDLSATDISRKNQVTIAATQRIAYPSEGSIARYLKDPKKQQESINRDDARLAITTAGLTSVGGIERLTYTCKHVDLSHNQIDFDDAESAVISTYFDKVETLDLSHNVTTELHPEFYANAPELQTLSLASNKLTTISPDALKSVPKLALLDLSNNNLKDLPADFLKHAPVTLKLNLEGNPLSEQFKASMPAHLKKMINNFEESQRTEQPASHQ